MPFTFPLNIMMVTHGRHIKAYVIKRDAKYQKLCGCWGNSHKSEGGTTKTQQLKWSFMVWIEVVKKQQRMVIIYYGSKIQILGGKIHSLNITRYTCSNIAHESYSCFTATFWLQTLS